MPLVAWLTDLHLNFVSAQEVRTFADAIRGEGPDVVLIGGDTAEASTIVKTLGGLADTIQRPVYFVLGNHDFYMGSIAEVRSAVGDLSRDPNGLSWLPMAGVAELSPSTGLVGHGSWADGRLGDYWQSPMLLNDYHLIHELSELSDAERLDKLHVLGDEAAAHFRTVLPIALERYRSVILLTHVPPFREACWHAGKVSDDEHLPHFSSKAAGEALLEVMEAYPDAEVTVLCGHTHGRGQVRIRKNLRVLTGEATYGVPAIQRIIEID